VKGNKMYITIGEGIALVVGIFLVASILAVSVLGLEKLVSQLYRNGR
jgi:hypothetical protein